MSTECERVESQRTDGPDGPENLGSLGGEIAAMGGLLDHARSILGLLASLPAVRDAGPAQRAHAVRLRDLEQGLEACDALLTRLLGPGWRNGTSG